MRVMESQLMETLIGILVMKKCRKTEIFDVDNSSSSHATNRKVRFLELEEVPAYGINGSFGSPAKNV